MVTMENQSFLPLVQFLIVFLYFKKKHFSFIVFFIFVVVTMFWILLDQNGIKASDDNKYIKYNCIYEKHNRKQKK